MGRFYSSQLDNLNTIKVPSSFNSDSVQVELFDKFGGLLSPIGSKKNPATSCMDIYNCNGASFKPGKYWIDPNEGSSKDAIQVFCKGPETCITPVKEFTYEEGAIPLRFLRLKHNSVRQNISYSCDSGVDGFMLVKLLGENGDVITFNDKTVRMISQPGECPVVLEVSTADSDLSNSALPVQGIIPDANSKSQSYSAGALCFY